MMRMLPSVRRAPDDRSCAGAKRRSHGFTLLELMLAAALGAALLAAVVRLFASLGSSHAALAGQARMQESARHALSFLARSAHHAGYLGCGAVGVPVNGLNGDWQQLPEFNVATPIAAFDGDANGWQPGLAALPTKRGGRAGFKARNRIDPRRLRQGSDVVVFRRIRPGARLAASLAKNTDALRVADGDSSLRKDSFAVLSACGQAALFRVTSRAGGAVATLARASGGGTFGNRAGASLSAAGLPFGGPTSPEGASVGLVSTEIYFVARSAGSDNRGGLAWSLWRKTSAAAPAELVPGIDDLQLLYGIDSTPDDATRAPERYVAAHEIGASAVRSLHISVQVTSAGAADSSRRVLRQTFSRTVARRNQ